jgi:hypothetical protein
MAKLTLDEQRKILGYVRGVLSAACAGGRDPEAPELPVLAAPGACFVTLRENGNVRGCIGSVEAFEPLADNLRRNAENAAFSDPAFPPLEADELAFTTVEVALPSPPRRLAAPEEPDLERDGLLIVLGTRRAVFLPGTVAEQRWTLPEAWEQLALKVGLPPGAWRDPATGLYAFECEIFAE